jgi:Xaa-Pro aminopeptidase
MNTRLQRLRERIADEGLDAILISQPENRRYLSGFTGSAGVLLISQEQALLATDFRYYEQVKRQAPDFRLVEVNDTLHGVLSNLIATLGFRRLGFESHVLTVETYEQWKAAMPAVEWVPTSGIVERLRQVKDAEELAAIQRAVRIADEAMAHFMEWVRPGVTELQAAWELEVYMRTHGAERLSFPIIVASGENAAMPHAVSSDRVIHLGDPLVVDIGAVYAGYCSDLTRSFCIGQPDDKYLAIWDLVLKAQLAAEKALRPGMLGNEADAVARQIIYDGGYEGKFGHGLGHGVGLAIHEEPRASQTYKEPLPRGAILTVEPGIYLPGWGGVRIEDMVFLTDDEVQVLTQAPKVPFIEAR